MIGDVYTTEKYNKLSIFGVRHYEIGDWRLLTIQFTSCLFGTIDSIFAWSVADRGFEHRLGHIKYFKIVFSCFCAKHTVLRRKSKDRLALNQDNVSDWSDMYIHELFQRTSSKEIQLSVLIYKNVIISSTCNMFSPWYNWNSWWIRCELQSRSIKFYWFWNTYIHFIEIFSK